MFRDWALTGPAARLQPGSFVLSTPAEAIRYVSGVKSLLAAILFLAQLQPFLGSAACLFASSNQVSQEECQMPDQGPLPHHSAAAPDGTPLPDCALAAACAPSPLAVVTLPESVDTITVLNSQPPIITTDLLVGIASAPPLPPPRV